MSKSFRYPNHGTCSRETLITLNEDHTIESIQVMGGCNGNLKGHQQPAAGHEGRGRHCPYGGYHLRSPVPPAARTRSHRICAAPWQSWAKSCKTIQ